VQSLEAELRELDTLFNEEEIDYALCGGMAFLFAPFPWKGSSK